MPSSPPDKIDPALCPFHEPGEQGKRKAPGICVSFRHPPARRDWEQKALELYKAGFNDVQIAQKLDISAFMVGNFRKKKGLPRVRPKFTRFNFDQQTAMEMYKAGKSDREIGDKVGIGRETISRWRKENGLPTNENPYKPQPRLDWEKIMQLYEQGYTDMHIARIIGCSDRTVQKWRKKNNLPSKHKKGGKQ